MSTVKGVVDIPAVPSGEAEPAGFGFFSMVVSVNLSLLILLQLSLLHKTRPHGEDVRESVSVKLHHSAAIGSNYP
jgi:hypothetical protein